MDIDLPSWFFSPLPALAFLFPGCACCGTEGVGFSICGQDGTPARIQEVDKYDIGSDSWTARADLSPARDLHAAAIEGGLPHSFGGVTVTTAPLADNNVDEFDDGADSWAADTNTLDWLANEGAFDLADKGYVVAGNDRVGALQELVELSAGTWTARANITGAARNIIGSCRIDAAGYYFGGSSAGAHQDDTEEYVVDSWTVKTNMLENRGSLRAAAIDDLGYVTGGLTSTVRQDDNDEFDPVADAYTAKTALAAAVNLHGMFATGVHLAIFGGLKPAVSDETLSYDPVGDSYATKSVMAQATRGHAGVAAA